ncbi:MAG: hypothetical protein HXY37_12580 [Chloroflexi bacterium]|nr:hypothetical protein [Chloroflexota bacterium]
MEQETQAGSHQQWSRVQVIIALIGAASTVIVALIGLLSVLIDPTPEAGPAVIVVVPTAAPQASPAPPNVPVATAGAAPAAIPAAAPTASVSTAAPAPSGAFPCDATVSAWNAVELNVVRDFPEQSALLREPVTVGTAVHVLDVSGTTPPWYRIASPAGRVLGWIPAEYLALAATCPQP